MTPLLTASIIIIPTSSFMFVLFSTRLHMRLTRRSPNVQWMRTLTGLEAHDPPMGRGDTVSAVLLIALCQFLTALLIVEGSDSNDRFATLAIIGGLAEWALASAWVGLLIVKSSPWREPPDGGSDSVS